MGFLDGLRGGQYLGFNAGGLQLSDLSKFVQPAQRTRVSGSSGGDSDPYVGLRGETSVFAQQEADVNSQLSSINESMTEAYSNYEYTGDKKYLDEATQLYTQYAGLKEQQTTMLSGRNTLKTRLEETTKHYENISPNAKLLTSQNTAFGYQQGENLLGQGKRFSTPMEGLNYAHEASGSPENYMKPNLPNLYGYGYGKDANLRGYIQKTFQDSQESYSGFGRINEEAIEKDANTGAIVNKWYEMYDKDNTGNVNTVVTGIYSNLSKDNKLEAKSDVLSIIEKFNLTGSYSDLMKAILLEIPYAKITQKEKETDAEFKARVESIDNSVMNEWKAQGFNAIKDTDNGIYVIQYDITNGIPNDPATLDNLAKLYTMNTALEISGAYKIEDHKISLNRFVANTTKVTVNNGGEDLEHLTMNKITQGVMYYLTGNDEKNLLGLEPRSIFGSNNMKIDFNKVTIGNTYDVDFSMPVGNQGAVHVDIGGSINSLGLEGFNAVSETGVLSEMPEFGEYGQKAETYYPKAFAREFTDNDNSTFKPLVVNNVDVLGISTLDPNYFKFSDKRVLPFGKTAFDKVDSGGAKIYKYEDIINKSDYTPEAKTYLTDMFNDIQKLDVYFNKQSNRGASEAVKLEFQQAYSTIVTKYIKMLTNKSKYASHDGMTGISKEDIDMFLLNTSRMADYKFSNQSLKDDMLKNPALNGSNKIHSYDPTKYGIKTYPKSLYHDENGEWGKVKDQNGIRKSQLYMGVNAERVVDITASGFGNYNNLSFVVNSTNVDKGIYANNYNLKELMDMAYPTERARRSAFTSVEALKGSSADKLNLLINNLSNELGITIINPYTRGSADNVLLVSNVYIPFTMAQAVGAWGGKQDRNLYEETKRQGIIFEGEDAYTTLMRLKN